MGEGFGTLFLSCISREILPTRKLVQQVEYVLVNNESGKENDARTEEKQYATIKEGTVQLNS
jgi:hypothetical protein